MRTQRLLIPIIFGALAWHAVTCGAEGAEKSVQGTGRVTHITYGSPSWNTDSRKIDDAYLILRDKTSGKLVQIQLEETEPDSGQFSGQFSVSLGDQITPEIYIPPQSLRKGDRDNHQLYEMIKSGKLSRKPMIWKKNEKGQAVMDVYDTREQAETALKAYEEDQKIAQDLKRKKASGKPAASGTLDAKAAEHKAQMDKLAMEAAKRTAERLRMEQLEKQKAEERERKMKEMSEYEKAERRQRAVKANAKGQAYYIAGDFKNAEAEFKQAVELDPEAKEYYYKYGVTLYRNQKFNEALVILKASKVEPSLETERTYYMGLVHYRLLELDNALAKFNQVGQSKDPTLGPSGTFYAGIICFSQEKYDAAKLDFEKVIDTSSDPNLDAQAEEYIDRIAAAQAFQKLRENKFTATAVIGLMYDSNVLLSPDNATSTATNKADERLLTTFDLQYRPIYNEVNDLSPHATVSLTNSARAASAIADPFIYTLAVPYSRNLKLGSKAARLTATPGYELLYMDPYNTGTKQKEQTSYYLTVDSSIFMSKSWIAGYTLEYRKDDSSDASSIGDADLDSNKYTLRTNQTFILDKKKMLLPSLAYVRNTAKGKDKVYNRYDLGLTYAAPFVWETTYSAGLAYYNMKYVTATTPRTDNNYTLTLGLSKPVRSWVTWGLTGTYTKNGSNVEASAYTKYMVLTTATFMTNF